MVCVRVACRSGAAHVSTAGCDLLGPIDIKRYAPPQPRLPLRTTQSTQLRNQQLPLVSAGDYDKTSF